MNEHDNSVIRVEFDEHVAVLSLDRPEKMNAMGQAIWEELPAAIDRIDANDDIRAVALVANGPAFSVGLDFIDMIPQLGLNSAGPDGHRQRELHRLIRKMQAAVTAVERCRVPVVAAIHGYCLGAGVDLITACDIRVASQDAIFGVREPRVAIVADLGTLQRLPRLIGVGQARELIYSGRDFDSNEALQLGLVNRVLADPARTRASAISLAQEIAENAPLAVQGSKRVMLEAQRGDIDRELEYVATWNAAHLISQDLGRAVEAFVKKSKPRFDGR